MTRFGKVKAFLKHLLNVSRAFLYIINLGLYLLLGLGIAFVGLLYFDVKLDLPRRVEQFLKEELKKEGIILEAKSIKFDLRANIIVEDTSLKFVATATDFLRADRMSFGLSFKALLEKKAVLDYVFVENAVLSPVNIDVEDLSLLYKISLRAFRKGDIWDIYNFKSNLGGLSININGELDRRFFESKDKKDEGLSMENYLVLWEETSHILNEVKAYADDLNSPILFLDFNISKDRVEEIFCIFRARDVVFPLESHTLHLENLKLGLWLDSEGIEAKQAKIFARALGFSLDEELSSRALNIRTSFNYGNFEGVEDIYLLDLNLWASDFAYQDSKLNHISLSSSELHFDRTPRDLDFYIKRGQSYVDMSMSLDKNSIEVDFDYFDNPLDYLEFEALQDLKNLKAIKELSTEKALSIRGNLQVDFEEAIDKWELLKLDFDKFKAIEDVKATAFVFGEDIVFAKENVEEVYGRAEFSLSENGLWLKDIYLITSNDCALTGEIFQDIANLDYIFNLEGRFEPHCLDNVMAPWWKMVFSNFKLLEYPDVGVYVKGRWKRPQFTYVYADIAVPRAKYHDYEFEDISLLLNVNPDIICAYDIKLYGGDGYANACLYWDYDPKLGLVKYLNRGIVANLNMNYDAIKALGGDDVDELLDLISFDNTVFIDFSLNTLNPRRDPYFEQEIEFRFNSPQPIKVSYFDFDAIAGKGNAKGNNFYLKDISAKFFDGNLHGDFSLEKRDDKNYFKTKIDGENLNQGKLLDLISEISKEGKNIEPIDESNYLGKVKSSLTAEGFLLDFNSYKLEANISVDNQELKKMNILGGLSRVLEGVGIPLTTLEFNEFTGDFSLEDSEIYFSNFELKSPTSTSFGKAKYAPLSDDLSARMYFNWKVSGSIPILGHISDFVFDPILDSILIVISDTLSSPSFSPRIRPFNIFNSSKTMIENIDKDSL